VAARTNKRPRIESSSSSETDPVGNRSNGVQQ
jgi:hypothetical protein